MYENCYGTTPSVSTIPMKKPCWKDFVEIMKRSHKKVTISKDEQKVVFSQDSLGVDNEFMKDTNLNRTRLAGKDNIGHDWGGGKVIKKADYEKDFYPFWKFISNSRAIYQGGVNVVNSGKPKASLALSSSECKKYANNISAAGYNGGYNNPRNPKGCFSQVANNGKKYVYYNKNGSANCGAHGVSFCIQKNSENSRTVGKGKWPEFKRRMLKINGVSDLGDETLLCAPFMGVGRTLRNY